MVDTAELLATSLAIRAIELLDEREFVVFANLDAERPETFLNFGRFRDVLLVIYQQGVDDARVGGGCVNPAAV